jgi:hypothetical protein
MCTFISESFHLLSAEFQVRLPLIAVKAEESQVFRRIRPASCNGLDVIDLKAVKTPTP